MENKHGKERLRAWIKSEGRKVTWLASAIPVNRSHLHLWLNGTHTPRAIYREKIETITSGSVPMDSWEKRDG